MANVCTTSMLMMSFLPQISCRLLLPKGTITERPMVSKAHVEREVYFPEVTRVRSCATHGISTCPVCHSDDYARRRVCKVVCSALKRMNIRKSMSVLKYLGADSWSQVLMYLADKREAWNVAYPEVPMTLTNTALDHIRPVSSFRKCSVGVQKTLCNHYTNLQPLLHEDNSWKGDSWCLEDEKYWHDNIILHSSYSDIYYPKKAPSQPSLLRVIC
jgi:hypothetical protein